MVAMLKRIFLAILFEIAICSFLVLCIFFVAATNTSLPPAASAAIGLTALVIWSACTTYAVLYGADLTST